jgi:cystathionine beta-lyase family protein involved in aluminum resistance
LKKKTINETLKEQFAVDERVSHYVDKIEAQVAALTREIDELGQLHQYRVIAAMQKHKLSERHFAVATGYGYDDVTRSG